MGEGTGQEETGRGFIQFQAAVLTACTGEVAEELVGSDQKLKVF